MTALRPGTSQAVDHLKQTKAELMQGILRQATIAARTGMPVLIEGETGTGKEVLASLIHQSSRRTQQNFIAVNCAAIPAELAEAEFFGHKRGAFTGAATQREGYFKAADKGTLFLDEVGELSLPLQAKLLRALQEKRILPVGSDTEVEVDVRIIAATKRDLAEMVKSGAFREDLYYRLNVVALRMPALRDRPEDVPPLAAHFLAKHIADNELPALQLSQDSVLAMQKYNWPGNIRQMSNAIASSTIRAMSAGRDIIGPEDLSLPIRRDAVIPGVETRITASLGPAFASAKLLNAPPLIYRSVLPETEIDRLALDRPSAEIILDVACKIMAKNSLRAFMLTSIRHATDKLSIAAAAQDMGESPRVVRELAANARKLLRDRLAESHPGLEASPVLYKRVYQEAEEDAQRYPFFNDEQLASVTGENLVRLQIADLLLNNLHYHRVAWSLMQTGELVKAFAAQAVIPGEWHAYQQFLKTFDNNANTLLRTEASLPLRSLQ